MAAVALWLAGHAPALGAPARQVTIDLSGLVVQNKLAQSANSLPAQIEPATAYSYSIAGTVHGNGLFADFFADGTPVDTALDTIKPGLASLLNATEPNPTGQLPIVLFNELQSGADGILGINITATADFGASIDGSGAVTFSISDVSIAVAGAANSADSITFEAGSTMTVTAVTPPIAVTGTANGITMTTATLNGTVNPEGAPTTANFLWGPTSSYGYVQSIPQIPAGLAPVAVSGSLSNLTSGTTYHYALSVANASGTSQSADMTFQTLPPPPPGSPTVATGGATDITFTGATLTAGVNPNGSDTSVVFEYGLDANYGSTTSPVDVGAGDVVVSATAAIGGLDAGTTYHYRAVATNTNGVIPGLDQTFQTTAGMLPTVISGSAGGIGLTAATVYGLVNPNGADTSVTFEYGLTGSYGSTIAAQDIGAGPGQLAVSGTLTGLIPGTIYHFRTDATNSAGLVTGADRIFATTSVSYGDYGGKYSGLFISDPATLATSGIFTLVINPSGVFTASGKLGGKSISFKGVFQQNGAAIVDLPRTGITAHFQLAGSGPGRGITGSLSGSDTALVSAPLALGVASPGLYTVRLPHPLDTALPQGNGYGSLKVSPAGVVTFTGKLGDGTPLTFSSLLVSGSTFPLYAPLYGATGALVGDAVFETSANGALDASLAWFKPAAANSPAFSAPLELYGSAYMPPARGNAVIGASGGAFLFTSGTKAFSQSVTLSTSDRISPVSPNPQKFRASVAAATGLFTGSLIDPGTGKAAPFGGAFFQDTNLGTGLFETKPRPGEVDFQPGQ